MTQATILSVPTIVYLPYAFFNVVRLDEYHNCYTGI